MQDVAAAHVSIRVSENRRPPDSVWPADAVRSMSASTRPREDFGINEHLTKHIDELDLQVSEQARAAHPAIQVLMAVLGDGLRPCAQ
jgi:hypothetical protein